MKHRTSRKSAGVGACAASLRAPRRCARLAVNGAAGALLLAGCVGPNFHRPAPPTVDRYTAEPLADRTSAAEGIGGAAQRWAENRDIPAKWWTLFQSEPLNTLIEQALKANPDLQAAQAALRVAMENVYAQRGAYYPSLNGSATASRNQNAVEPAPTLTSSVLLFNLYQAELNASWTLDVFGANRRTVEALKAQADSQRFQLEATDIALTANVVAAAVQEAALRAQIAATQGIVRADTEALDILRKQLSLGIAAGIDVAAQEAALAQAEQTLPPLQKQLAQQRDLLSVLAGRFPGEGITQEFELASLHLPEELPVSLPSKLVEQRPDIRVAEANLHAASAQIGVAIANRLPNLTLTAAGGNVSTMVSDLFKSSNEFWSAGAGLTQPIFQGRTLLHRQRAARAAYDQAAAQYRSTVLRAFQKVADTLHAIRWDADALRAAVAAEQAAKESFEITRRNLELGAVSDLALLNAEQSWRQAEINLAQAQANRYADTAALFQALGGGWWNR
jgi:NodT family efflux transporter outer membrane factor (OMF) lipoprotein